MYMVIQMSFLDKTISKKKNIVLFLLVIAIISSITLFLIPNMSRGHDLAFHLSRISAIKDNLKLGIMGGYIYPNYLGGYGYGNGLFYPDLFLYIPAFFSYLGLSVITSYKLFLLLISFCSVGAMYICVKEISKNKKSALISSFIYGFASYRLIDMFTRAALGETLAFVFAPIIIYGMYEIIYGDYKKFYILTIGMSGLILSHLISTYLIGIVLVIMCLVNIKKLFKEKKRILYLVLAALATVCLTAYFIFPMLEQMLSGKFIFNNLDETSKLLERSLPIWSIFIEFPYHVLRKLWIPTGIGIGFIVLIYYYFKNFKNYDKFTHFCFITAMIFLICATNIFPWNLFQNILSPIQFPWRFYFISVLLLSVGSGLMLSKSTKDINKRVRVLFILFLIPVITISTVNFFEKNIKEVGDYEISFGEYMPLSADKNYILERKDVITTTYPLEHSFTRNGLELTINYNNNQGNNSLELPLLYYKGYKAISNDKELNVYQTNNGLVGVDINDEEGTIYVYYGGTKIQKLSKIVSIITMIVFVIYLRLRKRGVLDEK